MAENKEPASVRLSSENKGIIPSPKRLWALDTTRRYLEGNSPDGNEQATINELAERGSFVGGGAGSWTLERPGDPPVVDAGLKRFLDILRPTPVAMQSEEWCMKQFERLQEWLVDSKITNVGEANRYLLRLAEKLAPLEDDEAVERTRAMIQQKERVGERFKFTKWFQQPDLASVLMKIGSPELVAQLVREINAREHIHDLEDQWTAAGGSEEVLGKLVTDTKRVNLAPDQLIALSHLPQTKETNTTTGEKVSLSWHLSRAINIYENYLGKWAKAEEEFRKGRIDLVRKEAVIQQAQRELIQLRSDPTKQEGAPLYVQLDGVPMDKIRALLTSRPTVLANYRPDFQAYVASLPAGAKVSLYELFGKDKNPLCCETDNLDDAWSQHVISFLSGSTDAELLARRFLRVSGEAGELNTTWVATALDGSDVQKLFRMEERRRRQAKSNKPHGPEVTLGKFPERNGRGWMRKAKVRSFTNPSVEKTVFEELRTGIPFHRIRWESLPAGTYTGDFLVGLLRSLKVFGVCTTKDLDLKALQGDGPEAINQAFLDAWGPKFRPDGTPTYRPEKSPWVWFAIGLLSEINPEGKKLPGMKAAPPRTARLKYDTDLSAKAELRIAITYEDSFARPLTATGFLTKEELAYVEKFCQVSPKIFGLIRW